MTTITDTSRSRYAIPGGDDLFILGWREPRWSTARFTITQGMETLADNADWPTAWRIVAPIVRFVPDTEALLRAALPAV